MKITKLSTTNYKNAVRVDLDLDQNGNLIFIAGNNGAGKTSVLDSIAAALGGANSKATPKPIRDGETKAEIVLETEELVVTRRFTPSGSTLSVTSKDGAKYSKGQAKLDELVGKLSMDPFAFTQLDDKKQLAQLLDLVELPFDPDVLEAERKSVFEERTAVKRCAGEFEAQLKQYGETPEGLPSAEVSVSELLDQYRAGQNENAKISGAKKKVFDLAYNVRTLEEQLELARGLYDSALEDPNQSREEIDLAEIQLKIDGAEETNRLVRKKQERGSVQFQYEATADQAKALSAKLDEIAKTKADGLATAKFPVDGLGFDENGVTYQGVPFKQASTAEQIRVSMGMAIALNPKLRVIRITDGSLLDANSMALIEEMARENDYQVWLEIVGEGPDGAYTIVDGEVA